MSLATRANGSVVTQSWFNDIIALLCGDLLPRDSSADPLDLGGILGNSSTLFSALEVVTGDFSIGDIKVIHSYNGLNAPGAGWMLCDGRVINESNYNTEHGAGLWASEIGTSALDGKYLPNLVNRYMVGAATTPQSGASAITSVGNAGNLKSSWPHTHRWYHHIASTSTNDQSFDSNGSLINLSNSGSSNRYALLIGPTTAGISADLYTTTGQNFETRDIRPASFEVLHYLRII